MESVEDINLKKLNTENEIRELKNKINDLEKNPDFKNNVIQASYTALNQQLASLYNRLTSLEENLRFNLQNASSLNLINLATTSTNQTVGPVQLPLPEKFVLIFDPYSSSYVKIKLDRNFQISVTELKDQIRKANNDDCFENILFKRESYTSWQKLPIMDNTYVFLNEVYSYQLDYSIIKSDTNNNSLKYKKMN